MENILDMTHEQLMAADVQVRQDYRKALHNSFYCIVKNYFDAGYKHVQIGFISCIKLKSNKNGKYFVTRAGKGYGCDTGEFTNLKDATDQLAECGHYNSTFTTISAK